jgi:hypothetical protein
MHTRHEGDNQQAIAGGDGLSGAEERHTFHTQNTQRCACHKRQSPGKRQAVVERVCHATIYTTSTVMDEPETFRPFTPFLLP